MMNWMGKIVFFIAVMGGAVAQATTVYTENFDAADFTVESRDPIELGGAKPAIDTGEWMGSHADAAMTTALDLSQVDSKNRFRGGAVWLDTAGWAVGTVTVKFDVSNWAAGVNGSAYYQTLTATGVDAANSVSIDLSAGPYGAAFAQAGTAVISAGAQNVVAGNGTQSFTFNYTGAEQYVGLLFGVVSGTENGDQTGAMSVDNLTVTTTTPKPAAIPKPATIGILGLGALMTLLIRKNEPE
jgi:hypothetical protein